MKYTRFEQLPCWQKARELCQEVYKLINKPAFSKDFSLKDQIRRASVSIMSNIAEGFDTSTDKEFVRYLYYAKSSASEVQSHLYVAMDLAYISQDKFDELYSLCTKIKNMIGGLIRYLKINRIPKHSDGDTP